MQTVEFSHFPLERGDWVLDLGCGEGRHVISAYVAADVHSVGVDLSLADLVTTREKFADFEEPENSAKSFSLSSASALALPFGGGAFDVVTSLSSLHYWPEPGRGLAEALSQPEAVRLWMGDAVSRGEFASLREALAQVDRLRTVTEDGVEVIFDPQSATVMHGCTVTRCVSVKYDGRATWQVRKGFRTFHSDYGRARDALRFALKVWKAQARASR